MEESGNGRGISLRSALGEPLVGIAACLALGILVNESLRPGLAVSYAAAAFALLAWLWRDRTATLWLFCFAAGGLLHFLQTGADRTAPLFDEISGAPLPVEVEGVIVSAPDPAEPGADRKRFDLRLETIAREGGERHVVHRNRVAVELRGPAAVAYGDRVKLSGGLRTPREVRNPAAFDYAAFLRHRGIYAELTAEGHELEVVGEGEGHPLVALGLRGRAWVSKQLTRGLEERPEEERALILAMTLGAREDTPEYIEDKFRFSGTLHVFAVSGLHVGIIASVVWLLSTGAASVFRTPQKYAVLVTIAAVLGYALVTGLRPPALRAAVMASIYFGGRLFDREPQIFNSTGAAAVCILLVDTSQLFRPGFQLSFCVLVAIAAIATPLSLRIGRPFARDPFFPNSLVTPGMRTYYSAARYATGLVGMSIAAWAGSVLLSWHYFGLVTPVSVFANLLLIPLAYLVLSTAAFSIILGLVPHPAPAVFANETNLLWTGCAAGTAGWFSEVPGGHFNVPAFSNIARAPCEITVLDLRYGGSAAHLTFRGPADWLIDTGSASSFESQTDRLLRSYAPGSLDGLALTHADTNHAGGGRLATERYTPTVLLTTPYDSTSPPWRDALVAANESGTPVARPASGDRFEIDGGHTLHVLYPPAQDAPGFVADDRGLVLRLDLATGWRVLFIADAGFYTGRWLAENIAALELRCDVLVRGTHNGDDSTLPGLLDLSQPQAIVLTSRSKRDEVPLGGSWANDAIAGGATVFDQHVTGAVTMRFHEDRAVLSAFLGDQSVSLNRAE